MSVLVTVTLKQGEAGKFCVIHIRVGVKVSISVLLVGEVREIEGGSPGAEIVKL